MDSLRLVGSSRFEGSSLEQGRTYHDLPFREYVSVPAHRRGTVERGHQIVQAVLGVDGWRGLDIGCSVGGLSFFLQLQGAHMLGVDYDPESLAVAVDIEASKRTGAEFMLMDVGSPAFQELLDGREFDFCVWLSNFMWVCKQRGPEEAMAVLDAVSRAIPILFFETAAGPGDGRAGQYVPAASQGEVGGMLSKFYGGVVDLGPAPGAWHQRNVFLCQP